MQKLQIKLDYTPDVVVINGIKFLPSKKGSKKPFFTCKYSGESFDRNDRCYVIQQNELDIKPSIAMIDKYDYNTTQIAYFHNKLDAINWSQQKFGNK